MTQSLHTSTVHKTASLSDEGNSAYCQSSGAHNIKRKMLIFICIKSCIKTGYKKIEKSLQYSLLIGFMYMQPSSAIDICSQFRNIFPTRMGSQIKEIIIMLNGKVSHVYGMG